MAHSKGNYSARADLDAVAMEGGYVNFGRNESQNWLNSSGFWRNSCCIAKSEEDENRLECQTNELTVVLDMITSADCKLPGCSAGASVIDQEPTP